MLTISGLMPHPPIIIPEIGGPERVKVAKTCQMMEELSRQVVNTQPDTIIIITPHGMGFKKAISVSTNQRLKGDFGLFGVKEVSLEFKNDIDFVNRFSELAADKGLNIAKLEENIMSRSYNELDHGALVPLYYLREAGFKGEIVSIAIAPLEYSSIYLIGDVIQDIISGTKKRYALIASGDLSHRLTTDAPGGYDENGSIFDEELLKHLQDFDIKGIMEMDKELINRAGECGLRPVIMMAGTLSKYEPEVEVLSYEGPFGVGYAVVSIYPDKKIKEEICKSSYKKTEEDIDKGAVFIDLAKSAIDTYIKTGRRIFPPIDLPREFKKQAGTFVSLKDKYGNLRGCIGTIEPQRRSLAEEIIFNAISSAVRDPRFSPVKADELDDLRISVDVLGEPEDIKDISELDPKKYGVIVTRSGRKGLLLPDLEGVDTPEKQVEIAKRKAGIVQEDVKLKRFEVKRYN